FPQGSTRCALRFHRRPIDLRASGGTLDPGVIARSRAQQPVVIPVVWTPVASNTSLPKLIFSRQLLNRSGSAKGLPVSDEVGIMPRCARLLPRSIVLLGAVRLVSTNAAPNKNDTATPILTSTTSGTPISAPIEIVVLTPITRFLMKKPSTR